MITVKAIIAKDCRLEDYIYYKAEFKAEGIKTIRTRGNISKEEAQNDLIEIMKNRLMNAKNEVEVLTKYFEENPK